MWLENHLHNDIVYITKKLSTVGKVEIVTNEDVLKAKTLKELYNANASRVLISMYDGKHQIKKFRSITKGSKVPEDFVILRDRWYSKDNNFGVKLTNRTGTIKIEVRHQSLFIKLAITHPTSFL